ncbi:BQ2448_7115 [Microbotryum intermedium]|uniref:U3 small nucleolar RNA-associated protein 10 n=1 Tax=Microbotryum intermedium TaxID=269621 RepID=A0A238FH95_9BASI|nr:BQ2448_7115 [Microbotryum intermedium]
MSSSLAAQLAQRTTLDSVRLQSAKSLKNPPSFIFSPRHATSVSTADLHALASNAWDQLSTLDPFFERYHARILGEEAKTTDRSALTKEDNDRFGQVLDKVLRALGKHMLLKPAGVVLEWLVRRFRVNDLNTASLIALFMPYHTTAHFPSALNLVAEPTLRETAPFSLLLDARASLAPIALPDLISLIPPFSPRPTARGLLDFLLRLPLAYLEADEKVHRALTGFWLQFVAGYIDRAGSKLPEGERAVVLSTILEVLRSSRDQPDLLIATYILLARFSLHLPFQGETLRVVVKTIVSNKARRDAGDEETDAAYITTLIVVTQLGQGLVDVGEGKKFLGGSGWKSLMKVDRLCELLVQLCNQYDAEKFMTPFLNTLAVQAVESKAEADVLSKLLLPTDDGEQISPSVLPDTIVALLTRSVVSAALGASPHLSKHSLVHALSQVHQRWPAIWSKELNLRTSTLSSNDKSKFWSLVNAVLSGGQIVGDDLESSSVFLAASDPDVAVRVKALNEVLLSADSLAVSNPSFVHDTLVARLSESDAAVISAVLSPSALSILNKYVGGVEQLQALKASLSVSSPKLASLKLVFPYLANAFVVQFPALADRVVQEVFWSRLLSAKADHAQRIVAWVALKDSKLETSSSWLKGVGASLDTNLDPGSDEFSAGAIHANEAVVDALARNLAGLAQEQLVIAQDYLLSSVAPIAVNAKADETSSAEATNQLLSYLVSARIAGQIEPQLRNRFALNVFGRITESALGLDAFENGQVELVADLAAGLPSAAMGNAVVTRPTQHKTLRRVQTVLLLSVVESVQGDEERRWSWLAPQDGENDSDLQGFALAVYQLAHARSAVESVPSALASSLLRSLFGHMVVVDTLAFLASVFSSNTMSIELRVIALRDTAVYVQAQASPDLRKPVDWQVVVPAIVLALTSPDRRIRVEAMSLVSVLLHAMPKSSAHIYGREKFYGPHSSSDLQYLDVADTAEYLAKIAAAKTEILMDGSYLITLHGSLLDAPSDKSSACHPSPTKKKATLKVKVATFLLSHALAWRSDLVTRFTFLRILSRVRDSFMASLVLPILRQVIADYSVEERLNLSKGVDSNVVAEFGRELLQPFDGASKKWIDSSAGNQAFETLVKVMNLEELSGVGAALRQQAFNILGSSLFSVVRGEDRLDMFKRLVRLGVHQDARLAAAPLAAVRAVKVDAETLTLILNELNLSLASPVSKGAKRGRMSLGSSSVNSGSRTERVSELVVVLESVDFAKIDPVPSLLLALFELLSSMIEVPTTAQIDVQYPGQLVLSNLSALLSRVDPNANLIVADSIRMSPVLDLMRTSTNPQTYHQALLLFAQLAPLVPDQIVHHVMPIFTFVGANVIQRDDAYSLRVVDQTLESIIPALVKSTKRKSGNREALVANLKDLLQVFADAAEHMPRHRRIKLFVRLVETLGSQDFLSAMAMLLAERDIKTADGSPLSSLVLEHFSIEVQLTAFHQIVAEVGHLLEGEPSFLDRRAGTEEMDSEANDAVALQIDQQLSLLASTLESRQLLGKVHAARAAGLDEVDSSLTSLIRALLNLVPPPTSTLTQKGKAELAAVTNSCVQSTVHLMSTSSFSESILWLLDQSDATIQPRAFGLLRTRLPKIKPARRAEISPAVVCVVDRAQTLVSETPKNRDGALETLFVIASSVYPNEDTALAKVVPHMIAVASSTENDVSTRVLAINIVTKLTNRLGPRLIPLAAKIVPFAVDMLHSVAKHPAGLSAIAPPIFEMLEGLFSSIPTFIGVHADKVFQIALSADVLALAGTKETTASKARVALLSTAAKRLPSKVLYPSIIRIHASLGSSPTSTGMLGLLDVLNRALRYGKVPDIAEAYRSIFKLFLSIFDLRRLQPPSLRVEDLDRIEDSGLGAFVQFILKLNEQTFRPLFLRTYDWAAIDLAEQGEAVLTPRRIVLYKLMDRLLTQLRSIVVPYFSFMLDQTTELLAAFARGANQDVALWSAVTSALTKSIDFHDGNFWTPLRLGKLSTPIADQVLVSHHVLTPVLFKSHYEPLLSQYSLRLVAHERLLKQFNMSLLMHTRSDDLRVKRRALEALEQVWVALGDGMLGLVPETTPFLSETLEESEGGVESATRSLIKRIEEHLGESLDSFLEA